MPVHPNSLANLKPHEIGVPNPGSGDISQAKKAAFRSETQRQLAEIEHGEVTKIARTVDSMIRESWNGKNKVGAATWLRDTHDGLLTQKHEIAHEGFVQASVKLITIVVPDTLEQFTQLQALAEANGQTPRQYAVQCLTQCLGEGP